MDKKKISDAQRAAQKKYDKKTKMISIKYTPADMDEYEKLQQFLEKSNQSANKFIKNVIYDYLQENEKDQIMNGDDINRFERSTKHNENEKYMYNPFEGIKEKNIQYLYDHFESDIVNTLFDEYRIRTLYNMKKVNTEKFNHWVENRIKILVERNPKLSKAGKGMELLRLFNRLIE